MEGERNTSEERGHGSTPAVSIEPGVVKETIREILLEIPGFRTLAERGIPENALGGTSNGGDGTQAVPVAADGSAGPPGASKGSMPAMAINSPIRDDKRGRQRPPLGNT